MNPVRVLRVVTAVVLLVTLGWAVPSAHACACGAVEPSNERELGVNSETAAIMYDGTTETMAISMGLQTSSPEAAFLLPLPTTAEVATADKELFDQLFDYTKPETRTRYRYWEFGDGSGGGGAPGSGATEGGATVEGRQRVGDYDVVQLSGTADEVGEWLTENDFRVRPDVVAGLGEYLDQDWNVMAVKLVFDGDFTGAMVPLVVSFPTDELVYPMKLSGLAERRQNLRFYVFAEHRMDVRIGDTELSTYFAGRVDAATLREAGAPAAADLVGDGEYVLTRIDDQVRPDRITDDLGFSPHTAGDVEHREVEWVTVDRTWVTVLAIVGGVLVLAGATSAVALVSYRRGRRAWRGE
ncbi:DUF2330 domain-containing protein [Propionibacteriaceae bacterium Y2011]|uniref:DUF2330 domain-containing protein n=1 Tax=Microlunatus sp. Y2014 TaxID=3418488 RepID=UPI003B4D542B